MGFLVTIVMVFRADMSIESANFVTGGINFIRSKHPVVTIFHDISSAVYRFFSQGVIRKSL